MAGILLELNPMALTDEQMQAIRDEETYRHAFRASLPPAKPAKSGAGRLAAFFESKVGFWLMTTVLAGLVATGWAKLNDYLNRESFQRQERAERSRRDTDMLLKLGPMLRSKNSAEVSFAVVLLDGLALDEAIDKRLVGQIKALVDNTLAIGLDPNASEQQRASANAIVAYADRDRVAKIQGQGAQPAAEKPEGATISAAIDSPALPARVYVQVASQADRAIGEAAGERLRAAGLLVPGVEVVGSARSPKEDSVRYCEGKIGSDALERVKVGAEKAKLVVLAPKLCGAVRYNHFELWLAPRSES